MRNKLGLWPDNGVRIVPLYTHGYRLELLGGDASAGPAPKPDAAPTGGTRRRRAAGRQPALGPNP
ncbi:hypothetical protein D3C71_2130040 [compost metagenome]